jgi:hypothetical protein
MQSLPDARSQSFEELYGPPENFLEIEVTYPRDIATHQPGSHLSRAIGPQPDDTR